jgi:hypothetical protein
MLRWTTQECPLGRCPNRPPGASMSESLTSYLVKVEFICKGGIFTGVDKCFKRQEQRLRARVRFMCKGEIFTWGYR